MYSDKAASSQPVDSNGAADQPPSNGKRAREDDGGDEPAAKKVDVKTETVSTDA